MTPGTTTGDSTKASTSGLSRLFHCASPSAASVPKIIDSMVEATPMIMLFFSAFIQRGELMKSSYQRKESPGSGYVRYEPELNDSGMIARLGVIRKMNTSVEINMVAV